MLDIYTFEIKAEEFDKILAGKKNIHLAINDSKRKSLAIGNVITFILKNDESAVGVEAAETSEEKIVKATIKNLLYFNTIEEVFEMLGKENCGYAPRSSSDKATDKFLSQESFEKIEKNGIVAIMFDLNK